MLYESPHGNVNLTAFDMLFMFSFLSLKFCLCGARWTLMKQNDDESILNLYARAPLLPAKPLSPSLTWKVDISFIRGLIALLTKIVDNIPTREPWQI